MVAATERRVELAVEDEQAMAVDGASVVSLGASPGVRIPRHRIRWRRILKGRQDVQVGYRVLTETTEMVVVETVGPVANSV